MAFNASTKILSFQILDAANLGGGGITLSGTDAREIIEDFLYNALTAGQNIDITYNDVPTPGVITIATTDNITVPGALAAGSTTITPTTSGIDVINFTEGEGGIICNDFTVSGTEFKLYSADANPVFLFYTTSGTIGVEADQDLIGLTDSIMYLRGNLLTNASGTYAIGSATVPFASGYFDDIYVKGASIHLGDTIELTESSSDLNINTDLVVQAASTIGWPTVKLSEYNSTDLQINSDIRLTGTSPVLYCPNLADSANFDIKLNHTAKNEQSLRILDNSDAEKFRVNVDTGEVFMHGVLTWASHGNEAYIFSDAGYDINIRLGDNAGANYLVIENSIGGDVASIDSNGNITTDAAATIGWPTVKLSEYNSTDLQINSDIRLIVTDPVIYATTLSNGGSFDLKINSGAKGTNNVRFLNSADSPFFAVNENGQIYQYGDVIYFNFAGDSGFNIEGSNDIFFNLGTTDGTTKVKIRDDNADDQAWIDSDGNAWFADVTPTASGTYDLGSKAYPFQAIYLEDQVTGAPYRITVESGVVTATAV